MYHVIIWNEEVERGYWINADSKAEAIHRAIIQELSIYRVPRYRIHIEKVE